jgi:hypothetical protein
VFAAGKKLHTAKLRIARSRCHLRAVKRAEGFTRAVGPSQFRAFQMQPNAIEIGQEQCDDLKRTQQQQQQQQQRRDTHCGFASDPVCKLSRKLAPADHVIVERSSAGGIPLPLRARKPRRLSSCTQVKNNSK